MTRLERKLLKRIGRANLEYSMIVPGDRVMVCLSGGKDSYGMLHLLRWMKRVVPFDFEMIAVNLDQGHPGFPVETLRGWLEAEGYTYKLISEDTYSVVLDLIEPGKTQCSLCSRLRRGILYNVAEDLNCTKIALGHHADDFIETLMLNTLYSGQLKSMAPYLVSDDGRNTVIRPLLYCSEENLIELSEQEQFPIIPCDLCGSQENLKRQQIKQMLANLHAENPKVKGNLLASLGNVRPTHLLDRTIQRVDERDSGVDARRSPRVPVSDGDEPAFS